MASSEVNELVSTIQVLKNKDLVAICYSNHLAKSGNKAELQRRIINLIDASVHDPNPQKFQEIRNSILQIASGNGPVNYRVSHFASSSIPSSPSYNGHSGMSSPYNNGGSGTTAAANGHSRVYAGDAMPRLGSYVHQGLQFKPSPFYRIEAPLGDVRPCEAMTQHRNSISISIRASTYPDLQRCLTDPTLRVMIFCAASNSGVQDVAFPYQCEIKVNGGEVKANLRGLKNKPGSTRPVDITDLLRLKPPSYSNSLEFTYALTSKRFYLALYICKTYSASLLASGIEKRNRITKASVIREVTRQALDPDIVATSTVLSLKCPLTYMRLSLPVRATTCKHIQCFDATSYLQLQEQGPQWLCPVCSNPASFESLAVDEYVKDILENTPTDLDQATIEPDGTWHTDKSRNGDTGGAGSTSPGAAGGTSFLDDDDIIIATPVNRRNGNGNGSMLGSASRDHTTATSRDTTATPSQSHSNKRPREVIDLTLSDDDDEPSGPPLKRQNTNGYSPAAGFSTSFGR